ncbi:hypothetical protein [Streptomyces sp. NPDC048442]|uniref:hypothetical protein n=1 Tax=Streptomyces sp. NPDC048442 TaxID=3154823 RepID=UPI0034455021
MNRQKIRIAAASALAAVAFGVAAPSAHAAESGRTPAPAVSVQHADAARLATLIAQNPAAATNGEAGLNAAVIAQLQNQQEVQQGSPRAEAIKALLKKSGSLFKAAVKNAKKGADAYRKWVDSLSNFNPVKWTLKALPGAVQYEIIDWLAKQVG